MWPQGSHILALLTELTGQSRLVWTNQQQQAFDAMKALISEDALLHYPDHNLPFTICSDASDYQLGSVILQGSVPVAYYSCKLTPAQHNYTTIEKEFLSIFETFREICSMLLGAKIHVYTDHHNLTYSKLSSQQVLCWRFFLEDFHPTFNYIASSDNKLTNALSHVPTADASASVEKSSGPVGPTPDLKDEYFCIEHDDPSLLECMLHHPDPAVIPFPLDYGLLAQ
jgi:hypothetical protein